MDSWRHGTTPRTSRPGATVLGVAALLAALGAQACRDGAVELPPAPPQPQPTTVAVHPATVSLKALGATVQLAAEVRDENGQVMSGAAVTWTSGDASVATVSASGLVTAVGRGRATVTATAGSAQGRSQIVVSPERATLEAIYRATDGPNWRNSDNWLTDAALADWYGVRTDTSGRVEGIDLYGNGLSGPIPTELADLEGLRYLNLGSNDFEGSIPPELGGLASLEQLRLASSGLTGSIPPALASLAELQVLELLANRLSGSIPPELGGLAKLSALYLLVNEFSGPIPPELGDLTRLTDLRLHRNQLSGPIPAELGGLPNLQRLNLSHNRLNGSIPAEFGHLQRLERLFLQSNDLTAIPAELGRLAGLRLLDVSDNALSGPIPPELGDLAQLEEMLLAKNGLSGVLPVEMGGMAGLKSLRLDFNELEGPIPPEFGSLGNLRELGLSANTAMAGALPERLTNLRLELLNARDTDLCIPREPAFLTWAGTIRMRQIGFCDGAMAAYLTQAVQSRQYPVPLVAGEKALLRVFVTAKKNTTEGMPPVRARFFVNGTEVHTAEIPAKPAVIPTGVDEGELANSANAEIPAGVVRTGLEMVVEIDPHGTLDSELGVPRRIPETGRMALEVREMPPMDLTVVPFLWSEDPDSAVLEAAARMENDAEASELLEPTRTFLPVADLRVAAHDAVESSANNGFDLLAETEAIRALEGGTGHWMGMMSGKVASPSGVAHLPGRVSFSIPHANIAAHELGHNMNLRHAPCGPAGSPDPLYPQRDGSIGAWGYDFRDGGRVVRPWQPDLMTYCEPRWISDFHFSKALVHRLLDEGAPEPPASAPGTSFAPAPTTARAPAPTTSLLLWGGVDSDGVLFLNPAFAVDARATLPRSTGDHRIAGWTEGGHQLFSVSFRMHELSEGGSSFAFVLPVQSARAATLAAITLSGPDGHTTLDARTNRPMAILRDPATGRVRAILRDVSGPAAGWHALAVDGPSALAADGRDADLVIRFSRGIPDADAWRR